ncbi:MAG: ABC-2 type transport system permease protein [Clostridium sp.]|jgi:ABC-2 type transport system permease protein
MFAGYKTQNDLMFSIVMPVTRKDIVKARVAIIVILELLHIVIAVIYGVISTHLYPNLTYFFFGPTIGFWGLCFIMLAIFNIIFISMFYKTAYKYGAATIAGITGADNMATQITILIVGIAIFAIFSVVAYSIAIKQFEKVDI